MASRERPKSGRPSPAKSPAVLATASTTSTSSAPALSTATTSQASRWSGNDSLDMEAARISTSTDGTGINVLNDPQTRQLMTKMALTKPSNAKLKSAPRVAVNHARFDPSTDDPFDGRMPPFGSAADSKRGATPKDPAVYDDDFEYISDSEPDPSQSAPSFGELFGSAGPRLIGRPVDTSVPSSAIAAKRPAKKSAVHHGGILGDLPPLPKKEAEDEGLIAALAESSIRHNAATELDAKTPSPAPSLSSSHAETKRSIAAPSSDSTSSSSSSSPMRIVAMPAGSGHGSGAVTRMIPQSPPRSPNTDRTHTHTHTHVHVHDGSNDNNDGSPLRVEPLLTARRAVPTRIQPLATGGSIASASHLPALPSTFAGSPLTRYRTPLGGIKSIATTSAVASSTSSALGAAPL